MVVLWEPKASHAVGTDSTTMPLVGNREATASRDGDGAAASGEVFPA